MVAFCTHRAQDGEATHSVAVDEGEITLEHRLDLIANLGL